MARKTYKLKRYLECQGHTGTVHMRELDYKPGQCSTGKQAVEIAVTSKHGDNWRPKTPMCVPVTVDLSTRRGRNRVAEDALSFFNEGCGRGLDGRRTRRRRRNRR